MIAALGKGLRRHESLRGRSPTATNDADEEGRLTREARQPEGLKWPLASRSRGSIGASHRDLSRKALAELALTFVGRSRPLRFPEGRLRRAETLPSGHWPCSRHASPCIALSIGGKVPELVATMPLSTSEPSRRRSVRLGKTADTDSVVADSMLLASSSLWPRDAR